MREIDRQTERKIKREIDRDRERVRHKERADNKNHWQRRDAQQVVNRNSMKTISDVSQALDIKYKKTSERYKLYMYGTNWKLLSKFKLYRNKIKYLKCS